VANGPINKGKLMVGDYEPLSRLRASAIAPAEAHTSEWKSLSRPLAQERAEVNVSVAPGERLTAKAPAGAVREFWNARQGHTFTFVALFLYTAIAYFRPYELSSAFSWTALLPYWMALGMLIIFIPSQFTLEGSLTARPREVNLVLLLTVTALLSIPLAASRADAWDMFSKVFIKTIIIFVVMVNVVRTERRLKSMIFLAFAAGFVMSAMALRDYGGGAASLDGFRAKAAINNMFGEPNAMSLHLVTMIPTAIALFLASKNPLKRLLYGGGAVLMIAGNFATQSRGGFLGIVVAGSVLAWKLGRKNRFLMIGVIVLSFMATLAFAPGGYGNRMATIFNPGADPNGSALARRELLKRSVTVALYNPAFGIGMGNFPIVGIRGQVSHNAFTQVAAELGLTAFALYILFIVSGYKRLRQIERETVGERRSRQYYLAVGLQASLAGYLVASFFLSVAYDWNLYILIAYAVCLHRIYETQLRSADNHRTGDTLQPARYSA
jgi:hypothetical protein